MEFNSPQMKAQIALLFRDHAHLLEEYWVFYEQLHSTLQHVSDDEDEEGDEVETDAVCSAQMMQSAKECLRIEKIENLKYQSQTQVLL